jgi:hypothetical protein
LNNTQHKNNIEFGYILLISILAFIFNPFFMLWLSVSTFADFLLYFGMIISPILAFFSFIFSIIYLKNNRTDNRGKKVLLLSIVNLLIVILFIFIWLTSGLGLA